MLPLFQSFLLIDEGGKRKKHEKSLSSGTPALSSLAPSPAPSKGKGRRVIARGSTAGALRVPKTASPMAVPSHGSCCRLPPNLSFKPKPQTTGQVRKHIGKDGRKTREGFKQLLVTEISPVAAERAAHGAPRHVQCFGEGGRVPASHGLAPCACRGVGTGHRVVCSQHGAAPAKAEQILCAGDQREPCSEPLGPQSQEKT